MKSQVGAPKHSDGIASSVARTVGFRDHAAEKNGAFDSVNVLRIGIDNIEALQEPLQK